MVEGKCDAYESMSQKMVQSMSSLIVLKFKSPDF